MYAKKPRYRLWVGILCVLLLCALIGSTVAKYITARELTGTVTFSAELATEMTLLESPANRQPNGSYILDTTAEKRTQNIYTLIPGLDVPKDPTITIKGKTPIEAYLFVTVRSTIPADSGITYSMLPNWKSLGDLHEDGSTVYVYAVENATPLDPIEIVGIGNGTDLTFKILKDDAVIVSQNLKKTVSDVSLEFFASLGETALSESKDASEVYKAINIP